MKARTCEKSYKIKGNININKNKTNKFTKKKQENKKLRKINQK